MVPAQREPRRLSWFQRASLLMLGFGLLGLLAMAGQLTPSARGYGTHRQLGLPPCTLRVMTGYRCPSCGMTTAWSHFARGEFAASWQVNAGGALLAVLAVFGGCSATLAGWTGRRWPPLDARIVAAVMLAVGLTTLLDWLGKLQL